MFKKASVSRSVSITGPRVFLLGLLLGFLALSPAILPYGGRFVTRGDFIEQQLPFLAEARRILRAGPNAYSFSTFLGAPALGSYAFYTLGSPFVWPLALLPEGCLPYAVSFMAVLKHACALCFSFLWLRRLLRDENIALLSAILYAFSSFSAVNTQFYHFWEVVAFFPLILLGMEEAMEDHGRPLLLALACGLNALTNYYFMFSSALLSGLYFLCRLFSPDWEKKRRLSAVLRALFYASAGCALSGPLLIPAMRFMLQITRTGARETPILMETYPPAVLLERLRSLLMPIESGVVHAWYGTAQSWSSTAAYLPAFGMTGALVFMKAPRRQRWLRALLLLLLAASCVPALSGAFALWTNLGYTRWWYGLAAFLSLATGYALKDTPWLSSAAPEDGRLWRRSFAACTAIVSLLILPGLLPDSAAASLPGRFAGFVRSLRSGAYARREFRIFSLAAALAGGGCFLLLPRCARRGGTAKAAAMVALFACLSYAGMIAVGDALIPAGGTLPGEGPYSLADVAEPSLSALPAPRTEGYRRIDYGRRLRNYGLLRGASSLTCFQSLRTSTVGRFVTAAGFGYDESTTVTPPDARGALRSVLSVTEYHATDEADPVPEGFVYDRTENGFPVYVNPNAVPMGFLQTAILPERRARLRAAVLGETLLSAAVVSDGVYGLLSPELPDAEETGASWQEKAADLRGRACSGFRTDGTGFSAEISAREDGLVVFTIPYDKGFSASVDGMPAEIFLCDLSFMAVRVTPGDHEIVFRYRTRGFTEGLFLLGCGSFALILAGILGRRQRAYRSSAQA